MYCIAGLVFNIVGLAFIVEFMNLLPTDNFPFLYLLEKLHNLFFRDNLSTGINPLCVEGNFFYTIKLLAGKALHTVTIRIVALCPFNKAVCGKILYNAPVLLVALGWLKDKGTIFFLAAVIRKDKLCLLVLVQVILGKLKKFVPGL